MSTKPTSKHNASLGIAAALCVATLTSAHAQDHRGGMIDSIMASLTVEEKVGQLVMPWLLGSYTSESGEGFVEAMRWIDEIGVGGLVISTGSPIAAAAKLNAFQRRSKLPLIVTADFEFGVAMRMTGSTAFPQAMGIGATGRELDAYQLGRITALESRAIGVHWTFSPVADLNNNPNNPIINTRSFGESPQAVAPLVAAYIRGATDHGLFTTAKHFPGHGDTGTDTHISLPILDACWPRLDTLELAPFKAAIAAGVTSIMTAHMALPCLDNGTPIPATLSPRITTEVLSDSLGFGGIVVTDALNMGAIVNEYGVGESAVQAFLAGSDVLLYPADPYEAFSATVTAVKNGRITGDRLDRSVRKLLELKNRAGLFRRRTVALDSVAQIVGIANHQTIADDIAARALTLVQPGRLQTFRSHRSRTAVITYAEQTNLRIGSTLNSELTELGDTVTSFRLFPASGSRSYDSAQTVIDRHDRVVFATSVRAISGLGHIALPEQLARMIQRTNRRKAVLLVSFGSPYLLQQLRGFDGAYLLAWTNVPATERAVALVMAGGAAVTGTLPITLRPDIPRGHGVTLPRQP